MIAFEASETIARHIANQVKGGRVLIYDNQTFNALQMYEAYAATISTLEIGFEMGGNNKSVTPLPDAQTIISTLAMVRSSTEYAPQTVDPNLNIVIAQLAHNLPSSVIFPKFLLFGTDDLSAPDPTNVQDKNCADIALTVPAQLACLIRVRQESQNNSNFTNMDKLFQSFLGGLMGVSSTAKTPKDPAAPDTANQPTSPQNTNQNQAPTTLPLTLIIQGRRLKTQLIDSKGSNRARLLVIEATATGGSYRLLHNFWVEVFWRTPTPAFNGGASITYFLIDPANSEIVQSEVLSYMYKYSKFKKLLAAPNPANSWP